MGLPGAGKTTVAQIIEGLTKAVLLSSDQERLNLWPEPSFSEAEHQKLYEYLNLKTAELLKSGKDVIYDANLNRKMHREEKYQLAEAVGAEPILIWVQTPRDTAKTRRIKELSHHKFVPKNETPEAMFERIADIFESPEETEPLILIDGTNITPLSVAQKLNQ